MTCVQVVDCLTLLKFSTTLDYEYVEIELQKYSIPTRSWIKLTIPKFDWILFEQFIATKQLPLVSNTEKVSIFYNKILDYNYLLPAECIDDQDASVELVFNYGRDARNYTMSVTSTMDKVTVTLNNNPNESITLKKYLWLALMIKREAASYNEIMADLGNRGFNSDEYKQIADPIRNSYALDCCRYDNDDNEDSALKFIINDLSESSNNKKYDVQMVTEIADDLFAQSKLSLETFAGEEEDNLDQATTPVLFESLLSDDNCPPSAPKKRKIDRRPFY